MSCRRNHHLGDVVRSIAHDDRFVVAEGLLTAHGEHRHAQVFLQDRSVVEGVLTNAAELRERRLHGAGTGVELGVMLAGAFIDFGRVAGELVPRTCMVAPSTLMS
jgi:hypothetical protein